jgi:hypothetical protein
MRIAKSMMKLGLPVLALLVLLGFADRSQAEGTSFGKPIFFSDGIACNAALLPWESVWLGHFSGGLASYQRGDAEIALAWQDQKLCFPSQQECMDWQKDQKSQFNQVEGYSTCMRIR